MTVAIIMLHLKDSICDCGKIASKSLQ